MVKIWHRAEKKALAMKDIHAGMVDTLTVRFHYVKKFNCKQAGDLEEEVSVLEKTNVWTSCKCHHRRKHGMQKLLYLLTIFKIAIQ